nr:PEP-CTERM sorting domain-containing protein [uncultured Duganella sp.]
MKVSSLISTALLALSLAGAVQAQPAAPEKQNSAPATIVLAQCEANDTAKCGISAPTANEAEADADVMPSENAQHVQNEPASPVPEPETFIMLMLGLVVLGIASHRNHTRDIFRKD